MKNKLLSYIFYSLFCLGSILIVSSSSTAAETCHQIDGKIVIGSVDATPVSHNSGGAYDKDNCVEAPLFYKLKMYKILLCTKDPYEPGGRTPDLESCEATLFSGEKDVVIEPDKETNILDGSDLLVPVDTYSYAVLIGGNHIGVKHWFHAVDANGDNIDMSGYANSSSAFSEGPICYTVIEAANNKEMATTYTGTDGTGGSGHGSSPHLSSDSVSRVYISSNTQNPKVSTMKCVSAAPTASTADWGYNYEIIDSIDSSCDDAGREDCDSTFGAHEDYFDMAADGVAIDGLAAFNLVQNNLTIAGNRFEATKIAYIVALNKKILISEETTGIKILVSTGQAVSIDMTFDSGGSVTGRDNVQAIKMGANPFGVRFLTKTSANSTFE